MPANKNRVWLITGCFSGFGRAIAQAALAQGDRVIGTLRQPTQSAEFAALAPGRSRAIELDVARSADIGPAIARAFECFGRVDVLVNNAGYGLLGAVEETSLDEARAIFETNFFGLMQVTQAALPRLRAQGSGHIINMSSGAGIGAVPGLALYSASKFAVEGLTEALAAEVAAHGIRVTLVEPGAYNTGFPTGGIKESSRRLEAYAPITGHGKAGLAAWYGANAGHPDAAARAILALADDDSPPLRLVLGADALQGAQRKLELLRRDFAASAAQQG